MFEIDCPQFETAIEKHKMAAGSADDASTRFEIIGLEIIKDVFIAKAEQAPIDLKPTPAPGPAQITELKTRLIENGKRREDKLPWAARMIKKFKTGTVGKWMPNKTAKANGSGAIAPSKNIKVIPLP